jgi:4-amino-4-deoxy-L-arabinose transferase-like glycosyltransferase
MIGNQSNDHSYSSFFGRSRVLAPVAHKRWVIFALLSAVILAGGLLRLHDLGESTIGHVEINTPGVDLPIGLADIPPRLTLIKSITGPIAGEPHPPGYYVFMFGWTKIFGVSIESLRLPSVLFGVGSILLLYLLGWLEYDRWSGLLAAAMLAFNGFHMYWSQIAKMMTMACFLGLLSSLLLLRLSQKTGRQIILQVLYLVTTLAGLATLVFFWPLFVGQMIWTTGRYLGTRRSMPGLLRLQLLVFILGSPLWAVAAFQSKRASYLDSNLLDGLGNYLQFGFLLQPNLYQPDPWVEAPSNPLGLALILILILVAGFLLVVALKSKRYKIFELTSISGPSTILLAAAGIAAFIGILGFSRLAYDKEPNQTSLVLATGIIPLLLPIFSYLIEKYWLRLHKIYCILSEKVTLPPGFKSLSAMLAILPAAILLGVSLFTPLWAARTALIFTPYLMLILAVGLATLISANPRWAVLLLVLIVVFGISIGHFKQILHHPTDYKGLAEQWIPQIEDSDIIFVQPNWVTTPIFYYLDADRYHVVGQEYLQVAQENPDSRIWVLSFEGMPMSTEEEDALRGYENTTRLDGLRISAALYSPEF